MCGAVSYDDGAGGGDAAVGEGHLQSGDTQAPPPNADDGDGATAQAAEAAIAVPPPHLHRFHQAAHDPRTRPRWHLHNTRMWLAPDDAEPLERTPATLHRTDATVRNAITALYCPRPITRGALAIGHGWRTCATCIPSGVLGHVPWRCQRIGAVTMRWELRDPWSNAVYCCISCYDSGGQEHDEWDASESPHRRPTHHRPPRRAAWRAHAAEWRPAGLSSHQLSPNNELLARASPRRRWPTCRRPPTGP